MKRGSKAVTEIESALRLDSPHHVQKNFSESTVYFVHPYNSAGFVKDETCFSAQ